MTRFPYIGFECDKEILSLERKLNMFQVNIKQVKAPSTEAEDGLACNYLYVVVFFLF